MEKIWRKLGSRKFLLAIWAVIMITYIICADKKDFISIANILSGYIIAYAGINYLGKKYDTNIPNNENESGGK